MEEIYVPSYTPTTHPNQEEKGPFGKLGAYLVDLIQTLVVCGAIFTIIYLFIARPHKVFGNSMVPNFRHGNYILTNIIAYRFGEPSYGDIIVLKNPNNLSQDFIKRVIATPGMTIKIEGQTVFLNGSPLKEDYLAPNTLTPAGSFLKNGEEVLVGPFQYFVLGDNRSHSSDSREWGPITKKGIIGKVFLRYWPPQNFALIKHL